LFTLLLNCLIVKYYSNRFSSIYPGDLYPFLRKPILLIVDSTNSSAFHNFPSLFQQPFISLLSPIAIPVAFKEKKHQQGNLFTMFLTNPLYGFCYICSVSNLTADMLSKAHYQLKLTFSEIVRAVYSSKKIGQTFLIYPSSFDFILSSFILLIIDSVYLKFFHDDFLKVFILRFIFCYNCLRLHRAFKVSIFQ
jgi:hypothetical protein